MRSLCAALAVAVVSVSCAREEAAVAAAPVIPAPQAHANLAQMMRGIPFTFSNIVFDAQSQDPAASREADPNGGATAQFRSVYGGWQEVENSALALAEAANLVVIPGRVCENGKPVPVQEATYIKAAQGLAEAGHAAYKAAQSRSIDAMIEVSDTVATACANCHEPYRDFDDPKDRCTPVEGRTAATD